MGNTSQILAVAFCFPAREDINETSHVLKARVAISTCNIIFSITAVLGNILIFIAFHNESSFHPPSKLLFRCLAVTDLGVGVFAQPAFVVYQLSIVASPLDLCRYRRTSFLYCNYDSLWSVHGYNGRNKRGQTFRLAVEDEVQTSCNSEARCSSCRHLLVPGHCGHYVGFWRQTCLPWFKLCINVTKCGDTNILLPENFFSHFVSREHRFMSKKYPCPIKGNRTEIISKLVPVTRRLYPVPWFSILSLFHVIFLML